MRTELSFNDSRSARAKPARPKGIRVCCGGKAYDKGHEAARGGRLQPDMCVHNPIAYLVVFKIMKRPAPPLPLLACRFQ